MDTGGLVDSAAGGVMVRKITGIKHEADGYGGKNYDLLLECGHIEKTRRTLVALRQGGELQLGQMHYCAVCSDIELQGGTPPVVPTKQRTGDQPLPTVNEEALCHDEVVKLLTAMSPANEQLIADINARKALGIQRYGHALQPRNGRDFLQDLYEEVLDACAYGNGAVREGLLDVTTYIKIVKLALKVRKLLDRRDGKIV
jgi:hypothetical protein